MQMKGEKDLGARSAAAEPQDSVLWKLIIQIHSISI